jgi:hypothetical protein
MCRDGLVKLQNSANSEGVISLLSKANRIFQPKSLLYIPNKQFFNLLIGYKCTLSGEMVFNLEAERASNPRLRSNQDGLSEGNYIWLCAFLPPSQL